MSTVTTQIRTLNEDLAASRAQKVIATLGHNVSLRGGIDTLKSLFDNVSEIKALNEKALIRTVNKKVQEKTGDEDFTLNVDAKRVLKIAHKLINGYKVKKELLSVAQIEQIVQFDKVHVNKLMKIKDDASYVDAVADLIKSARVERKTNVFSAKKARAHK